MSKNPLEDIDAKLENQKLDKEFLEQQEKAKETLPKQKKEVNNLLYKPASDYSKKFLENLKKLSDPKNINLAIKETGYNKKENQTQEDFIDELAEQWTKLQIKKENKENKEKNQNLNNSQEKETETTEIPKSAEPTTKETSEKVGNILDNNKTQESQQEKNQEIEENFSKIKDKINKPEYSILERLVESGELNAETKEVIEINIETNGNFDKDFEEAITDKDDLKKIQEILKQIPKNKESVPVDNLTNFKEDYPKLADIAINGIEAKSIKKGEEPKGSEILAYEEIAENYIKIGDDPEDKEKNYSAAIKTASANILKENKTIDKDQIKFKEAINKIHSTNTKEQFEGLTTLIEINEEGKTENGAKGKKLEFRNKKSKTKEKLIDKGNKIHEQLINENKKENKNYKKIEELNKKLNKIKDLLKPKSGEVMQGGKLDKVSNGPEKNSENS